MNAGLFSATVGRSVRAFVTVSAAADGRRVCALATEAQARKRRGEAWRRRQRQTAATCYRTVAKEENEKKASSLPPSLASYTPPHSSLPPSFLPSLSFLCMTTDGRRRRSAAGDHCHATTEPSRRAVRACVSERVLGFVWGKHLSYRSGSAEETSPQSLPSLLEFQAGGDGDWKGVIPPSARRSDHPRRHHHRHHLLGDRSNCSASWKSPLAATLLLLARSG